VIASVSLALRFLVAELGALAAFVWWGLDRGGFTIVLGVGAAALVVLLWGAFVGPRAPRRLADPARLGLELVIFAAATAALVDIGHPVLAAVFAVVAVGTTALVRVWPEPVQPVR
jgi:hypothetical protein